MEHKSPDACQSVIAPGASPKNNPRFTIKGLLFWTAVVAGVIPAVLSGQQDPTTGIFITGVYLTVVCGIATLVLHPRSFDAYIPICGINPNRTGNSRDLRRGARNFRRTKPLELGLEQRAW